MTDAPRPDLLPRAAAIRSKLIVVGLRLPGQAGHYFNELLGYKTAANALGLAHKIIVPRKTDPRLIASLSAETVTENLESLWPAIEAHDLKDTDILLFPRGHPTLISDIGSWLARRSPQRRPSVFFRLVGDEIIETKTAEYNGDAPFFRTACLDLRAQPGQERVFLLVESSVVARKVTRICCRRTFLMPMPKYLDVAAKGDVAEPAQPTVYVHVNWASGGLIRDLGDIIRRVRTAEPKVKFIVKTARLPSIARTALESGIASLAEIIPAGQDTADYLANFSRCTIVLLAYEPQVVTSGVFVEAASFGKPVVVPGGTWMAQQIVNGRGAGTIFKEPRTEPIVAALLEALTASERLGAAARALAPQVRNAHSSQRYIEQMMTLTRQMPDMEPRYQIGEEIDFSDSRDSRCFMGKGWGETERQGVWTVGPVAELNLWLESETDKGLTLRAFLQPFLTQTHRRISVRVSTAEGEIAQWTFSIDAPKAAEPRWCEASIPARDDKYRSRALEITFTIDSPASPLAEGVSTDPRILGIQLRRLLLRTVA